MLFLGTDDGEEPTLVYQSNMYVVVDLIDLKVLNVKRFNL